jgi:hypothetical protein
VTRIYSIIRFNHPFFTYPKQLVFIGAWPHAGEFLGMDLKSWKENQDGFGLQFLNNSIGWAEFIIYVQQGKGVL